MRVHFFKLYPSGLYTPLKAATCQVPPIVGDQVITEDGVYEVVRRQLDIVFTTPCYYVFVRATIPEEAVEVVCK